MIFPTLEAGTPGILIVMVLPFVLMIPQGSSPAIFWCTNPVQRESRGPCRFRQIAGQSLPSLKAIFWFEFYRQFAAYPVRKILTSRKKWRGRQPPGPEHDAD